MDQSPHEAPRGRRRVESGSPKEPPEREHAIEVTLDADAALAAVADAAEAWGAEWRRHGNGGRLELPVTAGLRHGRLSGTVWAEPTPEAGGGTRLRFRVDDSRWVIHWQAVVILLFGALGGIAFTLWPFYPPLLAIAPVALVLAFAAWFLVASRLRNAGPEEFFEAVEGRRTAR